MILVDTSVWIDHLHRGEAPLARALEDGLVLMHPFVVGEIACGNLRQRAEVLDLLASLPPAATVSADEALGFIERRALMGRGIGYVDVHLLAAAALTGVRLWTHDQSLARVANELGLGIER